MLTPEQIKELDKPLDNTRLKHRAGGGGMQLNYLAGYDVIATANKIFDYGGWGYDILAVDLNNVSGEDGQVIGCYYSARIRLSVSGCTSITEEGVCAVQAGRNARAVIDSHDMARKGAITDALKRAFRCYGDQFGNSLYDKDYDASTGTENQPTQRTQQVPTVQHMPINQQAARPVTPSRPPTPIQAQPAQPDEKITQKGIDSIVTLAGNKGLDEIALATKSIKLYKKPLHDLTLTEGQAFYRVLQQV